MTVGQRLREQRKKANLSLGQVAEYEGIGLQYLSKLERGVNSPPAWVLLAKLAIRYGTTADYLLGLTESPLPPFTVKQPGPAYVVHEGAIEYRTMPVDRQSVEALELYRRMSAEQRSAVDRIMRQFVELNTPRIVGGLPDPDE